MLQSTSHPPPPIVLPHTRAYVAMLGAAAPSTYILAPRSETPPSGTPPLLPIPLPTSSSPLILPSMSRREDVPMSSSAPTARPTGGFRADYGFVATLDDEIRRDPKREVGYGITYTWDEMLVGMPGAPTTNETELGRRMTDFVTTVRQDTDEIYERLDDAQDDRVLMSGQLNMLRRDRRDHAWTARLMDRGQTLLPGLVLAQQAEIAGLRTAERTRQTQLVEALTLLKALQIHVAALQRRWGPARGPAQPEIPEEASSST
nr:hypothetical protein [Tanacetum cinerariifolium]